MEKDCNDVALVCNDMFNCIFHNVFGWVPYRGSATGILLKKNRCSITKKT
jgi:hypothetical protein